METKSGRSAALITGASGGIGADLARVLAERKHDLVLVARSHDKLEALARELASAHGVTAIVMPADLTDPAAPDALAKELAARGVHVDVLVNNAGSGSYGAFAEIPAKQDLGMLALNVTSLTHLAKLFLPPMIEKKAGRIMNVASTAAFVPGPFMAVYYASKAYVLSLSYALANELDGSGVTVTCLCPGPTKTGFDSAAGADKTKLFQGGGVMESLEVARGGVDGMERGNVVVIPGFMNWMKSSSAGLLPRRLLAKIARGLQEPPAS
jgi:short-subunit dehydrogenase